MSTVGDGTQDLRVLAIDPGTTHSAYSYRSVYGEYVGDKVTNGHLLTLIDNWRDCGEFTHLSIEMMASYGNAMGQSVLQTCVWIGRFVERLRLPTKFIPRKEVVLHHCNSPRAGDSILRQALIDRFGGDKKYAIGTKKSPGPLYLFSNSDMRAALAVLLYAQDSVKSQGISWLTTNDGWSPEAEDSYWANPKSV